MSTPVMHKTQEGIYVRDKGEEGVREQQKEYNGLIKWCLKNNIRVENIWDIGAHIGWFPWYVNQHLKPKSILCIEPSPRQIQLLKLNLPTNAKLLEGAIVSDDYRGKTVPLYLAHKYSSGDCIFSIRGRNAVEVPALKISDIKGRMPSPDVIKIDAEGAEYIINWELHTPSSVKAIAAELHHLRPGHSELLLQLHTRWTDMGFTAIKSAKINNFRKMCSCLYVRT